jgi:hypothetical protein
VLLRGIRDLLVWLPIFAAPMWLLIWASESWAPVSELSWLPAGVADVVRSMSPPLLHGQAADAPDQRTLPAFGLMLAAAIVVFVGYVVAFAVYASWRPETSDAGWIRWPFWMIVILLLPASVPFVVGALYGWLLGSTLYVLGLWARVVIFMRNMQRPKSRVLRQTILEVPSSWIALSGAVSMLYGALLLSYSFAWWAARGPVMLETSFWVLSSALVMAVIVGVRGGFNLITINRFYDTLQMGGVVRSETNSAQFGGIRTKETVEQLPKEIK